MEGTISAEWLNYLVLSSVFQFQKFEGPKFFVIDYRSMRSTSINSTFVTFSKYIKIKEGDLISWEGINSVKCLNYLLPPSVFQFQNFEEPKFFIIH